MNLKDVEGIKRLLYLHCYCVDEMDADTWADLFTEDGSFSFSSSSYLIPNDPVVGKKALREWAAEAFPRAAGVHFAANEIISIDGDEATCTSYAVALRGEADPKITTAGKMEDTLRKVDGTWLILSRVVTLRVAAHG